MINIFIFRCANPKTLDIIIIILPTDWPKIIISTARTTKN